MKYTDDTLLTTGKYSFTKLARVPAKYLLAIYKNKTIKDESLYSYIEENLERIKSRLNEPIPLPEIELCEKTTYFSIKEAKCALTIINQDEREHKKPVRVYECLKCGGWHLTSITLDEWKEINN